MASLLAASETDDIASERDDASQKAPHMIGEQAIGIVDGLVHMMRFHDKETALHLDATAHLADRTARALGLDEATITRCRIGARLHDLGKIALDVRIINKPRSLSALEWTLMCLHPEKSAKLVSGIPLLADIAPIVRAHHERSDGRGYPDQRVGDEIPFESRVIAVADSFHTMTVPRPYRKPFTVEVALKELVANAGTQFDEDVVARSLRCSATRAASCAASRESGCDACASCGMPVLSPIPRIDGGAVSAGNALQFRQKRRPAIKGSGVRAGKP